MRRYVQPDAIALLIAIATIVFLVMSKTHDRYTASDAADDRAAIRAMICRHHPEDISCVGIQ